MKKLKKFYFYRKLYVWFNTKVIIYLPFIRPKLPSRVPHPREFCGMSQIESLQQNKLLRGRDSRRATKKSETKLLVAPTSRNLSIFNKLFRTKIVLPISLLLLTSCSSHNKAFQCPAADGVGCESVSTVNNLISSNSLDEYITFKADQSARKTHKKEHALRKQTIIHFESYKDEAGVMHSAHDVYLNE